KFIAKGALMAITDSVLLPEHTLADCAALDELQSVGSDLKPVCKADTFWTLRTRVYVLWQNGEAVKLARHALPLVDSSFLGWVNQCVRRGEAHAPCDAENPPCIIEGIGSERETMRATGEQ